MMFKHYSEFEGDWGWRNFKIEEMACHCCGEYWHDPYSLDLLQAARSFINVPFHINSSHRCKRHNAAVGGKKSSKHLKAAYDIRTELDPVELHRQLNLMYNSCCGLGLYSWGVHLDFRHKRARW